VVDVAHDRHDRRAVHEVLGRVFERRLDLDVVRGVDDLRSSCRTRRRAPGSPRRTASASTSQSQPSVISFLITSGTATPRYSGDVLDRRARVDAGSRPSPRARCCRSARSCRRRCRGDGGPGAGGAGAGWRVRPAGGAMPGSRSRRADDRGADAAGRVRSTRARVARRAARAHPGARVTPAAVVPGAAGGAGVAAAAGLSEARGAASWPGAGRPSSRRAPTAGPAPRAVRRTLRWRARGRGAVARRGRRGAIAERCSASVSSTEEARGLRLDPGSVQPLQQFLAGEAVLLGDLVYALLAHRLDDSTSLTSRTDRIHRDRPPQGTRERASPARLCEAAGRRLGIAPQSRARRGRDRHPAPASARADRAPRARADHSDSAAAATRSSSDFGATRPQPTQRRRGTCAPMACAPRRSGRAPARACSVGIAGAGGSAAATCSAGVPLAPPACGGQVADVVGVDVRERLVALDPAVARAGQRGVGATPAV